MDLMLLEGLITQEVGAALQALASKVPADQAIVEIGSYKGKSTCYLATGAKRGAGAHVWAIDPWDKDGNQTGRFGYANPETREAFHRQVRKAGLEANITAIQEFSAWAARHWAGPEIGLLYIDGDHEFESVRTDYLAWLQHLASKATVVFDDFGTPRNPGVRKAVKQLGLRCRIIADRLAVVSHA